MDRRGAHLAASLRASGQAEEIRRETGVPVHAMSPLVKWLFLKDRLPARARPVSLKDYVVFRLTGTWVTDYTTAAASGFLSVDNDWSSVALNAAGMSRDMLPRLAPIDERIISRDGQYEIVVGGNDAATAHAHLHIPNDGRIAVLAMGTSGALRTTWPSAVTSSELFCYTLGPGDGYLVGSAYSNVGNVLWWMARLFNQDLDSLIQGGLTAALSGRSLPLCLPYWHGERSPWWREDLRGAWLGLNPTHGPDDLAGAALLAIAASYQTGLHALKAVGAPTEEIRGGSGLLDQEGMAQWMADALGQTIVLRDDRDASLWGAADLALPDVRLDQPDHGRRYVPQRSDVATRAGGVFEQVRSIVATADVTGSRPRIFGPGA